MEFEVTEVPEATYAVIRATAELSEVSALIRSFLEQVGEWAMSSGAAAGPPLSITSMAEGGRLNLATGWTVAGSPGPPAPIELAVYPATRAAVHVHVGPYDDLPDVYRQFGAALAEAGLQPGAEPRELYESDPAVVTDPAQYRTRIIWPLD